MSGSNGAGTFMRYMQQLAASVPMRDPGLRQQYAPPYSPQRTDPDYQKNWQKSPQYSPPQDDTLLGPYMTAALGGAPEYQPLRNDAGKARVPPDFMYDVRPRPQNPAGVSQTQQSQPSAQDVAAFRREQARGIEQQQNVKQDVQAIQQGMVYGPGPVRGRTNLLPQYQNMGAIRPFGPGEFIDRGNGQISSEETITVPYGQGKWAVLPSLWMVHGQPMTLDEDTATQYAQQSGLNWPTFNSEAEANRFADQREQRWNQLPAGRTDMQPPLWSRQWPPQQK